MKTPAREAFLVELQGVFLGIVKCLITREYIKRQWAAQTVSIYF